MQDLVIKYLESKKLAWSYSTYKVESARLLAIAPLLNGDAASLHQKLSETLKPYTLVSMWNRIIEIYDLKDTANNPYRTFKMVNRRLFKNFYSRKELKLTFEEVKRKIDLISDKDAKEKALDLLRTGLRYTESMTEQDGYVVGKGAKVRKVYRAGNVSKVEYTKGYHSFYAELKRVGLTPHMLRKIAATELVNRGFKAPDLLKVFGWASINTAQYYLQPKQDEEILNVMEGLA